MARGPSRRSGGSRSSSSRSRSSSRSYRSSSSIYRTSYGPSYSYGRRRVYRSGRSSLASFLVFILFFMIMVTMSLWSDYEYNKNEFDYMIRDSETYYAMIEGADTDPMYKKTDAKIEDVWSYYWEDEGEYYYQIEYSYKNEFTNTYKYNNLTYYMYTRSDLVSMGCADFIGYGYGYNKPDVTIEIVYSYYDQINMDYDLYCADYYIYEAEYKSCLGGMFVAGAVSVVLLIIIIKLLKKDKEKNTKTVEQTTTTYSTAYTNDSPNTNINTEFPDFNTAFNSMFNNTKTEKEIFCEYCGSKILSGDIKCSSCGANVKKH